MYTIPYNRKKAIDYARKWAYGRNPKYANFDGMGGDCTNFASQVLYAGTGVMNYTKDTGWYYISLNNRAAAWTGVEYLYKFLITNKGAGPFAQEVKMNQIQPGDLIQLKLTKPQFSHTLVVVSVGENPHPSNILVAAHTFNAYDRPLSSYDYKAIRFLHILGARKS